MAKRAYNSREHREAVVRLRGLPCWMCGRPSNSVDHVPPLAAFPPGLWRGELRPACLPCNCSAGARLANGDRGSVSRGW